MQVGEIFGVALNVSILVASVATAILFFRTRSKMAGVMTAGVAIFWLGAALAFWGPRTITTISHPTSDGAHYESYATIEKPLLPTLYMIFAGKLIFVFGFLSYAIGARPPAKSE